MANMPVVDISEGAETPTKPTVFEAWVEVMRDLQGLGKNQRNNTPGGAYNFRGIDDLMNALGPILRTHGVFIVPEAADVTSTPIKAGSKRTDMAQALVQVSYRVYGPAGDSFVMAAVGEANDSGDKGTPKAMSVAYRTVLLQALTLPTNEPDPDSTSGVPTTISPEEELEEARVEGSRWANRRAREVNSTAEAVLRAITNNRDPRTYTLDQWRWVIDHLQDESNAGHWTPKQAEPGEPANVDQAVREMENAVRPDEQAQGQR